MEVESEKRRWLAYAIGWIAIFAVIGPILGIILMGAFVGPFAWLGIIIGFPMALIAGLASAPIAAWRHAATGPPSKRFAVTLGLIAGLLAPVGWVVLEGGTTRLWDNWIAALGAFAGAGCGLIAAHTLQRPDRRARWSKVINGLAYFLLAGVLAFATQAALAQPIDARVPSAIVAFDHPEGQFTRQGTTWIETNRAYTYTWTFHETRTDTQYIEAVDPTRNNMRLRLPVAGGWSELDQGKGWQRLYHVTPVVMKNRSGSSSTSVGEEYDGQD